MQTISLEYLNETHQLYLFKSTSSKGLVVFLHGAGEHALKYTRFAHDLNQANIDVLLFDQLGHGHAAKASNMVHYHDKYGHIKLLEFLDLVIKKAETLNPKLPMYLMGHSMGSFIGRAYLNRFNAPFEAALFIGSSLIKRRDLLLGKFLGLGIKSIKGPKYISPLFTKLMQDKPYHSMKKKGLIKYRYEWVSRDKALQASFKDDPLMNHPFTISAQLDIIRLMMIAQGRPSSSCTKKLNRLLFMVGSQDALCDYGNGTIKLAKKMQSVTTVDYRIYQGAYHELLHDLDYQEVTKDIITFLSKKA
jgi:alpha-beta hydrolase superfamily lysophospholipase